MILIQKIKYTFLFTIIVSLTLFFSTAKLVEAGSIVLDASKTNNIRIGEIVTVDVLLDIDDIPINLLSGELSFDTETFSLENIATANSVVSIWIDEPADEEGDINFAAMFPRGFVGVMAPERSTLLPGNLFTISLRAQKSGTGTLEFSEIESMFEEGEVMPPKHEALSLSIDQIKVIENQNIFNDEISTPSDVDNDQPGYFTPYFIHPDLDCESPTYIAFQTTDDNSGISHYEIGFTASESNLSNVSYATTTSPYELEDAHVGSFAVVKAVDRAGNERLSSVRITSADMYPEGCNTKDSSTSNMLIYLSIFALLIMLLVWRNRN